MVDYGILGYHEDKVSLLLLNNWDFFREEVDLINYLVNYSVVESI